MTCVSMQCLVQTLKTVDHHVFAIYILMSCHQIAHMYALVNYFHATKIETQ